MNKESRSRIILGAMLVGIVCCAIVIWLRISDGTNEDNMDGLLEIDVRLVWGKEISHILNLPQTSIHPSAVYAIGFVENASNSRAYAKITIEALFEEISLGSNTINVSLIAPHKKYGEPFL